MLAIFCVDENVDYASAYVQMTLEKVLVSHLRSQKSKSIDNWSDGKHQIVPLIARRTLSVLRRFFSKKSSTFSQRLFVESMLILCPFGGIDMKTGPLTAPTNNIILFIFKKLDTKII